MGITATIEGYYGTVEIVSAESLSVTAVTC